MLPKLLYFLLFFDLTFSATVEKDLEEPQCDLNEEYTLCGSNCPATCQTVSEPSKPSCLEGCNPGCFCKESFFRKAVDGPCVPYTQCSVVPICPANQDYWLCGSSCEPTCDDPLPRNCADKCVKGCFCSQTFIRDYKGGGCITDCITRE